MITEFQLQQMLEAQNANFQHALRQVQSAADRKVSAVEKRLHALQDDLSKLYADPSRLPNGKYRFIEDVPGKRHERWYVAEIPFLEGAAGEAQGSFEISTDGPFVCEYITPVWLATEDDDNVLPPQLQGRHLPITAMSGFVSAGGSTLLDTQGTNLVDIPELSLQLQVGGSGRQWTSGVIPGPAWYGSQGLPDRLSMPSFLDPNDRMIVKVTPERVIPHDGTCKVIFQGYEITTGVRLASVLQLTDH